MSDMIGPTQCSKRTALPREIPEGAVSAAANDGQPRMTQG